MKSEPKWIRFTNPGVFFVDDIINGHRQHALELFRALHLDLLTDREKAVLQLLAEGRSNKEAAVTLDLSPYTVESHRTHIVQKLHLHSSADLVLYAIRKKIIS